MIYKTIMFKFDSVKYKAALRVCEKIFSKKNFNQYKNEE